MVILHGCSKVWVLFYQEQYEGQQILGVYPTREAAEAARDDDDLASEYICEMEVGRTYGFGDISGE